MLSKLEFFILSQNSNLLIALLALVMKVAMEVLQLMPTTTYYKMLMNWRVNIPTKLLIANVLMIVPKQKYLLLNTKEYKQKAHLN